MSPATRAQDELVRMYQMVRPQIAIPVHGEARHLRGPCRARARLPGAARRWSSRTATWCGSTATAATIVDEVPVGRIASDGKSLLPIGGAVLQQRRRVGSDGSVVATLVVDRRGWLAAPPQVSLIGLAEADAEPAAALRDALADAMESAAGAAAARRQRAARGRPPGAAPRPQRALRQAPADRNPAGAAVRAAAMIGRLNHVAIVVPDLAAAAALYRDALGARVSAPHAAAGARRHRRVRRAAEQQDRAAGAARRRLAGARLSRHATRRAACTISATRSTTSVAARDRLRAAGARVLGDGEPQLGAHGKPVLFLHPKDFCGTLIELEEA